MALTEEQEAKLLQLLSAYENGKRVGDLPEVTPGKDSAGLMVEVVDTDGESKKFDLGNVAPVLNITSFGSEQPYGSRRLRRVDRKGNPVWSDRNDPNGYWLSPEEYDGECVPFIAEDGTMVYGANGKLLYIDATLGLQLVQETRAVSAFVAWDDFDVSRLKIGLRVSIKDLEGATDSNWSVSEIDEKGFTVRNANGETSQFFYEPELWVGKGTDGIEEGSHILPLAIGDGHYYFLGATRYPEYNYPYGNDIYIGGRYSFGIDSVLFGSDSPRFFTGFATYVSGSYANFEGFDDYEGLNVQLELTKGDDGFWYLSDPDFNATALERTRPDYFYSHMIPLRDYATLSSMVEGGFTNDCGQIVRGLVNPALSGDSLYNTISYLKGWVSRTRFCVTVMNSGGETVAEGYHLIPIQGGAIDAISSGYYGAIAIEFYLIAPDCRVYFVRLAYDSENNIIEEESIIPDGVY